MTFNFLLVFALKQSNLDVRALSLDRTKQTPNNLFLMFLCIIFRFTKKTLIDVFLDCLCIQFASAYRNCTLRAEVCMR